MINSGSGKILAGTVVCINSGYNRTVTVKASF